MSNNNGSKWINFLFGIVFSCFIGIIAWVHNREAVLIEFVREELKLHTNFHAERLSDELNNIRTTEHRIQETLDRMDERLFEIYKNNIVGSVHGE